MPEREALGQAVAELPISTGWEIKHTPDSGGDAQPALDFIARCDLFLIMLGGDFAAPMGLEWRQAQRAHRPMLAYCKERHHSPSARWLLRNCELVWSDFRSAAELKTLVKRDLAGVLLDRGEEVGLHLDDVEGLLAEIAKGQKETPDESDRRTGAGRGAVILGRDA